jgi:pyridoxamine 5'-phosphate oxidase family protein
LITSRKETTVQLSENERTFLTTQPLGRLATLAPQGAPQVRPVGFTLNEALGTIDIIGRNLAASQKFRNIRRDGRVSLVVDDLESTDPWKPRGIEIRGTAEALEESDATGGGTGALIRIHPERVLSWGIDSNAFAPPLTRDVHGSRARRDPEASGTPVDGSVHEGGPAAR